MSKNVKMTNPMKVITGPNTRWSYANVWEPKSINGGTPKYSVSLIIPKSDTKTVAKIEAAIEAAYREGEAKLKGNGSIDIETYSDVPLQKTGVYRYVESPDFEILLFAYSVDNQPVQVIDLACGEQIPKEILLALEDECVIKWAFNATFERICLSRFLGYPTGEYLKPESWRCSMIWSATMGLPLSLEGVTNQKAL